MEEIVELLNAGQYVKLRQLIAGYNVADIAAYMEKLEQDEVLKLFRILPKSMAADVFSYLEIETEQYIITSLSEKDAANIIDHLMADDATDLLEEMPANVVKRLLAHASADTRRDINHLLRYPEDSAGSIMTVEYVDLKETLTVEQAIARIRKVGVDSETINICYVLDQRRTLVGTVALRYLLLSPPDSVIGEIMNENITLNNSEWCMMEELWQEQPKTLMQLVHKMKEKQGWSKSTTSTVLRRMQEKGCVRYEEGEKARNYFTDLNREEVVLKETRAFLDRAFGGSLGLLVNTFVGGSQLTKEELEELREILHKEI